jgi:hypothetical protein
MMRRGKKRANKRSLFCELMAGAERIAHEARTVLNGGDPASRLSDSALTLAERHRAQLADRLTSSKDPAEQVGIKEDVA